MATAPLPDDYNHSGIPITVAQDTLPQYIVGEAPSITDLRRRFDEARSMPNVARDLPQRDRDYYDGPRQLNSDVRTTLQLRGQPAIYTNRVRPAVNGILGILEGARTDPRAYPRNPDDEDAADVATKALRFIADKCRFGDIKQDVADNFLVEGTGAAIIEFADGEITPTQIRWEEFYYDPYSRRADLADARYMGIAKWMDAAQLREKYKVRIDEIGDPMRPLDAGIVGDMYEDRPIGLGWVDIRRRRVMLIEEYAVERGEWKRIVYIAAGVLEYGPSPYLEFVEGGGQRPCNPIVAQSCYVDKENARYGTVRDMICIQDEINASRSRSLHLMNSRQIQCTDISAPPVDADTVRQEASKADGVIPMGWQKVDTSEMTQANMLRMQEAKAEIERMGPVPAIVGRAVAESSSGRSKQISQQAGMTELARPLGRLAGWELRCYVQMWFRAKQFWTTEKWVRITDNVRTPEFLKVNEPVTLNKALQAAMGGDKEAIAALGQIIPPEALQAASQGDPQAVALIQQYATVNGDMQVMVKNRLAEMDVDIILDTVPDTATLEEETWSDLRELAQAFVAMGKDIFSPEFELFIEMSPLQDKARILEKLKKFREESQQGQADQQQQAAQAQAVAQQLAMQKEQATIRKVVQDTKKSASETELNELKATQIAGETMSKLDTHAHTPHIPPDPVDDGDGNQ